nr:hypothetical protein [Tanacetum cinerariifolium]
MWEKIKGNDLWFLYLTWINPCSKSCSGDQRKTLGLTIRWEDLPFLAMKKLLSILLTNYTYGTIGDVVKWATNGLRKHISCADEGKSDVRNGVSFTVPACTSLHDVGLPTQLDATHAIDGMFLSAAKNAIFISVWVFTVRVLALQLAHWVFNCLICYCHMHMFCIRT